MSNEAVIAWSSAILTVATIAIVWLTWLNYQIYRKTIEDQQKHEQHFTDLLNAIVISNMTQGSGGSVSVSIENFKRHYTGKTPVFK